jgi:hypothetical protein
MQTGGVSWVPIHPFLPPRLAFAGGEPGQGRAWHWPPADFLCSGTPADLGALIYGYSARRLSYLVSACTRALDMAKSVVSPTLVFSIISNLVAKDIY